MPLNLNDLIKKAKAKGISPVSTNNNRAFSQPIRTWQQESILFSPSNKPTTNQQQTDNKEVTNWQQTDNKATTNKQQKINTTVETDNKVAAQPTTQPTTNWQQTNNKPTTKLPFSSLVGIQRALILFIYNECKIARSKSTENLTLEHISKTIKTSSGCIKTTLQRLETKGFINRIEYKNGRGGWSKYSISDQLFQEILQHETGNKLATNWQQTNNKVAAQPTTQPATTIPSSSGINNLNTTTTGGIENSIKHEKPPEEWRLDIEPLNGVGFTLTHLTQISSQNKLTAQVVQDSIYAFAFDLQENSKAKTIKGDPINFFMGILRNGKPYAPPSNYESPQDKAMREYLERMREIEQRRVGVEKEVMSLAFNDWFTQLTDDQKRELLPETLRRNAKLEKNKILESAARGHFEVEIWPNKKEKITQKIGS
ncbi:MAG: hypothetical protein ACD_21C00183G0002 [uncultured bacterium]|nr:MAG: hypothetical protein ACD_21C00183G0002 [uncultured bacterium]